MSTSPDVPPPIPAPEVVSEPVPAPVHLRDEGPVFVPEAPAPVVVDPPEQKKSLVQHPNGSEGWLPTEEAPPKPAQQSIPPAEQVSEPQVAAASFPKVNEDLPVRTDGEYATGGALLAGAAGAAVTAPVALKKAQSLGRSASRRSDFTTIEGRTVESGSAFTNGAGATGPMASVQEDAALRARAAEAHENLSPRQRAKIAREESKNGKRLSKIIRNEAKTEKQSLSIMISELEDLQKIQRNAVKSEAQVQENHSKLLSIFKKKEALFLNAKREYERAGAELNAEGETLEAVRANARDATARMQDKSAEVDSLRKTLAVDDRERELKLAQLEGRNNTKRSGLFWSN